PYSAYAVYFLAPPLGSFFHPLLFSTLLTCRREVKAAWATCRDGLASTLTRAFPSFFRPIFWAAACERSMIRPLARGPRSLIVTCTAWPVSKFVTFAVVPSGSVRWAAVSCCG